jgi:hypothetical protein
MSKESLSVKDFSWETAAGRPLGIGEITSKESMVEMSSSVKDFSWKQQLGDHQALEKL